MIGQLMSLTFRPAASYLLEKTVPLSSRKDIEMIVDSDIGRIFIHNGDKEIGGSIRTYKTWSPGEGRFLRHFLTQGMNVIDVGANIGYFTLLMNQQVAPSGRVLAVEPDSEAFALLQANVAQFGCGSVELLPVAATRASGLVTLSKDGQNFGAHKAYVVAGAVSYQPVQGVRLDDALDPDARIDFIKVDVEGMDHAAVEGMERTVRRWAPTMLVEFNPKNIEGFGEKPKEALYLYRNLDYEIRILGPDVLMLGSVAGLDVDDLVRDSLVLMPERDDEVIERTRRIGLINLILSPRPVYGFARKPL
jgi:FkbM family methyltransferase